MPKPPFLFFATSQAYIRPLNDHAVHLRSSYPFKPFPVFIVSILVINTSALQPRKPEIWTPKHHLCVDLVTKNFLFYITVKPSICPLFSTITMSLEQDLLISPAICHHNFTSSLLPPRLICFHGVLPTHCQCQLSYVFKPLLPKDSGRRPSSRARAIDVVVGRCGSFYVTSSDFSPQQKMRSSSEEGGSRRQRLEVWEEPRGTNLRNCEKTRFARTTLRSADYKWVLTACLWSGLPSDTSWREGPSHLQKSWAALV